MTHDWNHIWFDQMEKHQQFTNFRCELMWNSEEGAIYYADMMKKCNWGDYLLHEIKQFPKLEKLKILDIGAGPGTHSIPLALHVDHVTVIEPATGMIQFLKSTVKQKGLENLDYVKKRWEDIIPGKDIQNEYDIVIASFSLGMKDIAQAVQKMNQVGKTVYILWHVGIPIWEEMYFTLWEKIHNTMYYPVPKAEILIHILQQIGIQPSVKMLNFDNFYRFHSLDDAVQYFISELHANKPAHENIIRDYLATHLVKKENEFILGGKTYYALIRWENTEKS